MRSAYAFVKRFCKPNGQTPPTFFGDRQLRDLRGSDLRKLSQHRSCVSFPSQPMPSPERVRIKFPEFP